MDSRYVLVCENGDCGRRFQHRNGLGRHYQVSGHGPSPVSSRLVRIRKSYTFRQRRAYLLELDTLKITRKHDHLVACSRQSGVSISNLSKWEKDRVSIFENAQHKGGRRRNKLGRGGIHPRAAKLLYMRFLYRRKFLLKHVGRHWLKRNFRCILRDEGLDTEQKGNRASDGWCTNWLRSFKITKQCRTNKKHETLLERRPRIQAFLAKWLYGIQRSSPQVCPRYGRYPATHIFFGDQSPMEFRGNASRSTYDLKGAGKRGGGKLKDPGSDKRFCTIHITLRAEGNQCVRIEIIFRNKGVQLDDDEEAYYESLDNVIVRFQLKAWSDERIAMETLRAFRDQTAHLGDVALGMDNHSAQSTHLCRSYMEFVDVQPVYTPAECTDTVSPVDRNMAAAIKSRIKEFFDTEYEIDDEKWDEGLTAKQKRMLVAGWTSRAWADFCKEKPVQIRESFVKCGYLLACDGSENHLLDLQGWQKEWGPFEIPYPE